MAMGDHLVTSLGEWLTHHAIDIGDGTVVHWCSGIPSDQGIERALERKSQALIRRTTFDEFARGRDWQIRDYLSCDESEIVVERAISKVGDAGYSILWNNCEHFATWCKTGEATSAQVIDGSLAAVGLTSGVVRFVVTAPPVLVVMAPLMIVASAIAVPSMIGMGIAWLAREMFDQRSPDSVIEDSQCPRRISDGG